MIILFSDALVHPHEISPNLFQDMTEELQADVTRYRPLLLSI